MRLSITGSLLLPLMCACGGAELEDARHPTGSQTIAASSDYSALYVANTQEGTITRLPVDGSPTSIPLDGEPTRIARAGKRVFVSLRAVRQVAVLEDDGTTLVEIDRIRVGHEPFGVVANELGTRVYVASSLSNTIQEIDASTLAILREFEVSDEPRWLALHPDNSLYAGAAYGGVLYEIQLDIGQIIRMELPQLPVVSFGDPFSGGMNARITGDMAVTPDGKRLVIPTLYLDTTTVVNEPEEGEEIPPEERIPDQGGYAGPGRFNPTVTILSLDETHPRTNEATLIPMRSFTFDREVSGYPASVTISPDGKIGLATIEGSGAVIAFEIDAKDGDRGDVPQATSSVFFSGDAFDARPVMAFDVVAGARGVAFVSDERAFAYGFLDRAAAEIEIDADSWLQDLDPFRAVLGIRKVAIAESNLDAQLELGRRLFYSSSDERMSIPGSGLSCATCHFDGRTDGVSWSFERGPRQTPSLAGKVSLTAPVRWEGDRETVAADAMRTSQGLMGGQGLTELETLAIEAFIDSSRDVDSILKGEDDPRIARGEAIFNRPEVGCFNCHSGTRHTDNKIYSMFGMTAVKTRSLVGVSASAPYLHDGSSYTLRDLLVRLQSGEMGNTASLSDTELDELAAYLESL